MADIAMLAESMDGCGGVVATKPSQPSPDEVSWCPLVPVSIPGQGVAQSFLEQVRSSSSPARAVIQNPGAWCSRYGKEGDLLRLLLWAQEKLPEEERVLDTFNDRELNAEILLAARDEVGSQSMGSRAVRRQTRLAWDALITLYGSEEVLGRAMDAMKGTGADETLAETIALAERYLTGWRPKNFGE